MKRTGLLLLAIGLVITVFTGFKYVTREKVVDIGNIEITQNKKHNVAWSPIIGIAMMLVGGTVYLIGTKK